MYSNVNNILYSIYLQVLVSLNAVTNTNNFEYILPQQLVLEPGDVIGIYRASASQIFPLTVSDGSSPTLLISDSLIANFNSRNATALISNPLVTFASSSVKIVNLFYFMYVLHCFLVSNFKLISHIIHSYDISDPVSAHIK